MNNIIYYIRNNIYYRPTMNDIYYIKHYIKYNTYYIIYILYKCAAHKKAINMFNNFEGHSSISNAKLQT